MNNIEPKYSTFEQAKWLKEKGFNLPTLNWYHRGNKKFNTNDLLFSMNKLTDNYSAPEQWQVVEFLRINHGIWVSPGIITLNGVVKWFPRYFKFASTLLEISEDIDGNFDTPQEAYSAAFDYIKDNNLI
jgi:hypothetical protein